MKVKLSIIEVSGEVGDGLVCVIVNVVCEIMNIKIDFSLVDDMEVLEDLFLVVINCVLEVVVEKEVVEG